MGPIWGRQDLGGPHAGLMNFAIWDGLPLKRMKVSARESKINFAACTQS